MSSYSMALHNLSLAGPTLFGPVINKAAELSAQSSSSYQNKYFILLIITVSGGTFFFMIILLFSLFIFVACDFYI